MHFIVPLFTLFTENTAEREYLHDVHHTHMIYPMKPNWAQQSAIMYQEQSEEEKWGFMRHCSTPLAALRVDSMPTNTYYQLPFGYSMHISAAGGSV